MEQQQKEQIKGSSTPFNRLGVSSPISTARLVAKVNSLVSPVSSVATKPEHNSFQYKYSIDYESMVNKIADINLIDDINSYYLTVHKILTQYIDCSFTAFGLFNETSNCINLKLIDNLDNVYSSKIFSADSSNPVSQCFYTRKLIVRDDA